MNAQIKNGQLVIEIPITEEASKSGKNLLIASTHGNQQMPTVLHKGKPITVSVNAYIKP